jgi:hypothetical protein
MNLSVGDGADAGPIVITYFNIKANISFLDTKG